MDLHAAIEAARERYVEQFKLFVARQRKSCKRGGPEVIFEVGEDSGLFRRLYRVDFVKNDDKVEAIELSVEDDATTSPITVSVGAAKLTVVNLHWDNVVVHHDASWLFDKGLAVWFQAWFDPDDERHQPNAELSDTIHSLTFGPGIVEADLGTAPAAALWDLIHLIEHSRSTSIWIGSATDIHPRH